MNITSVFYKFPDQEACIAHLEKFAGAMIHIARIAGLQTWLVKMIKTALADGTVMDANPASTSWLVQSLKKPKYPFKNGFWVLP